MTIIPSQMTRLYDAVVERFVVPTLLDAGFRRKRRHFERETRAAVAMVKLQRSTGATRFTLGAGICFRAVANCCYGEGVLKDCIKHGMAFAPLRHPADPNIEHWFDMEETPDAIRLGEVASDLMRGSFLPRIRGMMRPSSDRALLLQGHHTPRGLGERPLTRLYFWLRHLQIAPEMDSVRASLTRLDAPMVDRIDQWRGPPEWLQDD